MCYQDERRTGIKIVGFLRLSLALYGTPAVALERITSEAPDLREPNTPRLVRNAKGWQQGSVGKRQNASTPQHHRPIYPGGSGTDKPR